MGSTQSNASGANAVTMLGADDTEEQFFSKPIENGAGLMTRSATNLSMIDTTLEADNTSKGSKDVTTRRPSAFEQENVDETESQNDGDPVMAFRSENTSESIHSSNVIKAIKTDKRKANLEAMDQIDFEVIKEGKKMEDEKEIDLEDPTLRIRKQQREESEDDSDDAGTIRDLAAKRRSIERRASKVSQGSVESLRNSGDFRDPNQARESGRPVRRQSTARGGRKHSTTTLNSINVRKTNNRVPGNSIRQLIEMPKGPEYGEKAYGDKLPYNGSLSGAAVVIRASNQAGEPSRVLDPNNMKRAKGKIYDLFHERGFKLVHPTKTTDHETDTGEVFIRLGNKERAKLWAKLKHRDFKVRELETYVYFRESRTGNGITYTVRFPKVGEYRLEVNIIEGAKNSLRRIADFVIYCSEISGDIRQFPVTNGTIVMFPTVALMSPTVRNIQRNRKVDFKILVKGALEVNVVTVPSYTFTPLTPSKVEDSIFEGNFIFENDEDTQVHLMGSLKPNTHSPMYEYILVEKRELQSSQCSTYSELDVPTKDTVSESLAHNNNIDMRSSLSTILELEDRASSKSDSPFIEGFK